jgi:hypothetical protein
MPFGLTNAPATYQRLMEKCLQARKRNGKLRVCIDFRLLNGRFVKDIYTLPRIEEIFDRYIATSIDMKSGYHHVEVEEIS